MLKFANSELVHYEEARDKLEGDYADRAPDEGLPIFNRALRQLQLSECPA